MPRRWLVVQAIPGKRDDLRKARIAMELFEIGFGFDALDHYQRTVQNAFAQ